jgi:putative acetyltransferase
LDISGLKDQSIKFWSLWENDELIGCGALKFLDKIHGEFKSIRVVDKFRKKGVGEKIFKHLIEEAKKLGIKKISIETGSGKFFKTARKLFEKFDFQPCSPFAHYKEDPNSCFYTKDLN